MHHNIECKILEGLQFENNTDQAKRKKNWMKKKNWSTWILSFEFLADVLGEECI